MSAHDAESVVVDPLAGTPIRSFVGGPLTFKVRGDQTGGRLAAFENRIPPGEGPPLHRHTAEDEICQVLDGELRFRLGDDVHRAPAGAFVFVARGVPHCFQNIATEPARILVLFTPAGMERFFDRFAALPDDADPAEAFRSLAHEVGMEMLGPPLAQSHPL